MQVKLQELRTEFERGQRQLAALDQQRNGLGDALLRISGAIQVLEELLHEQELANGGNRIAAEPVAG